MNRRQKSPWRMTRRARGRGFSFRADTADQLENRLSPLPRRARAAANTLALFIGALHLRTGKTFVLDRTQLAKIEALGLEERTIRTAIAELERLGVIERTGQATGYDHRGRGDRGRLWKRPVLWRLAPWLLTRSRSYQFRKTPISDLRSEERSYRRNPIVTILPPLKAIASDLLDALRADRTPLPHLSANALALTRSAWP